MSKIRFSYPFDILGANTSNAVEHDLVLGQSVKDRAFAWPTGPVFADTVRIVEASKPNVNLVRGKDYQLIIMEPRLTEMAQGREIIQGVVVFNKAISPNVTTYGQIVGGPWGVNVDGIEQAIQALDLDSRTVDWSNIANLPDTYQSAPAYSDVGDIFGFEYIITTLGSMVDVMRVGSNAKMETILESIADMRTDFQKALNEHINADGNVHTLTRTQLGVYSTAQVDTKVTHLLSELTKVNSEIAELKTSDVTLNNRLDSLVNSLKSYQYNLDDASRSYQAFTKQIADINQSIAELRTKNTEQDQRATKIEQKNTQQEQTMSGITQANGTIQKAQNDILRRLGSVENK